MILKLERLLSVAIITLAVGFFVTHNAGIVYGSDGLHVKDGGNVGIGTTTPQAKLEVNGGIKIGDDPTCNTSKNGTVRYHSEAMEFCDGTSWVPMGGGPDYESSWTSVSLNTNYTFTHNFGQLARDVRIWVAQNSDGSGWTFIANGLIRDSAGSYTITGTAVAQNNLNDVNIRVSEKLGYSHDGSGQGWRSSGYIKIMVWK